MSSQFKLMGERRFLPFFLTQFLGAFNDNVYKNALVVLITFQAARYTTLSPGVLVNLAAGIFILPFFLFSATFPPSRRQTGPTCCPRSSRRARGTGAC